METSLHAARRLFVCATLLGASAFLGGCTAPRQHDQAIRAVWVTRWDYHTPKDIRRIVANSQSVGLNTIFFQVRGQGTVAYRSRIEPWSGEFGGRDPGFDPLGVAVTEAHRHGLALHAWINVMPSWKGEEPPPDPRQLYNARPQWHLFDAQGRRQPLSDHYVILNPALPEVRKYLAAVCGEITGNYGVDGLHLDYIRFVTDESGAGRDYPYDRRTLELYQADTNLTPSRNRRRWDDWRRAAITELVRQIRDTTVRISPSTVLSAAVVADRVRARDDMFQDAETWLKDGLVDAVCPMAYRDNLAEFDHLIDDWRAHAHGRSVIPGIGLYKHDSDRMSFDQLKSAAKWGDGFALYAYSSLFASANPESQTSRTQRRLQNLTPMLKRLADDEQKKQKKDTWLASWTP